MTVAVDVRVNGRFSICEGNLDEGGREGGREGGMDGGREGGRKGRRVVGERRKVHVCIQ